MSQSSQATSVPSPLELSTQRPGTILPYKEFSYDYCTFCLDDKSTYSSEMHRDQANAVGTYESQHAIASKEMEIDKRMSEY